MLRFYMRHVRGEKISLLINIIFSPAVFLMGLVIAFMDFLRRHGLLRTEEPPLPLISVGNITYGGTNKTPFVEMLAKFACENGVKAGIVTRGYTGKTHNVILIRNGEGKRELTGDEPLLLSRELPDVPVAVAKKRIDGVRELKNSGVELVVADDAFQHRVLGRDVDIVLIDAMCPFGNGKLIPSGIMREKISALKRAHIVVLTKSDQVDKCELAKLRETVSKYVNPERVFTSRLEIDSWILRGTGIFGKLGQIKIEKFSLEAETFSDSKVLRGIRKVFAFSAIGSPESFKGLISSKGFVITGEKIFTDHHKYSSADIDEIKTSALSSGAEAVICTEKDLYNFPENYAWSGEIPLIVPKVKVIVNERDKFFAALVDCLRPKIIVASNGYGEDAIGVVLAKKLREKFPLSEVSAFPLVGRGEAYSRESFSVKSAPSVTPSGGVVKYSVKDLWGDMRAGLLKHIRSQLGDWVKIANEIRTPICVGDVYLILHTLLGSGKRPMFTATAKTVYLSGHWKIERALINKFTLRTWTRDAKSAEQLGGKAVYSGSPVMDLLENKASYLHEDKATYPGSPVMTLENSEHQRGDVILILPGSRQRACRDVKILLEAVEILHQHGEENFRMVLAPTLPLKEFFAACESSGW
ncbi:MAG: tetraacyldisaccharide 4'-kinase, partial [Synergistaceae bacterium]|nr:tetraacyldisaccharide 4'-kinase [Synergistaceae bacterium]